MINLKFYSYLIISFVSFWRLDASDIIFTSPLKTKALFNTIDNIISTLEKYIGDQENRLETMQSSLNEWVKEHDYYAENIETQLSNYVSQFNYLYTLKNRWTHWQNELKNNTAAEYISKMKNPNMTWPSDDDMIGIMDSIINLQNIYHMKADSFAQGILNGVSTNTSLNYEECFMMTERCFETIHYKLALQWGLVAMEKYSNEGIENEQQLSKLLYYISYTSHIAGNDDLALETITSYMEKNPHDEKAKALQKVIHLKHPEKLDKNVIKEMEISQRLKELCKKNTSQEELSRDNDLRCRYNTENSDFLIIAPLKEELLSYDPPLILFRDALYDSEIENLKDRSNKQVQEISTAKSSIRRFKGVKILNFEDDMDDDIRRISHRVEDMTELENKLKNKYQLHKYTLGGSYTHQEEENSVENSDWQISSTVIFHMNNVIQGGSTIFPRMNITVKTEKGDALVFYNTIQDHSNGLPEYSSCSVVAGQKWALITRISN